MSRLANTTNMIMKREILVKNYTDGQITQILFQSGDRNIINLVLELLVFNCFLSSTLKYQKYTCLTLSIISKDHVELCV